MDPTEALPQKVLYVKKGRIAPICIWEFQKMPHLLQNTRFIRHNYRCFKPRLDMSSQHAAEIEAGNRFAFGENWSRFLGVLHHTGNMSQALVNVSNLVQDGGRLFIAIYNNQGRASRSWLKVKKAYNRLPRGFRWLILWPSAFRLWGPTIIFDLVAGRPFHTWRNYSKGSLRGMSPWRDVVDWVGGLPFEVATPEQIFCSYRDRGFRLKELKTCAGGHGCNEFVFQKA